MAYERLTDPVRLRAVLEAVLSVRSDLEPNVVFHRIVALACYLAGARRGTLGLLDPLARDVQHFVTNGLTDGEALEVATLATQRSELSSDGEMGLLENSSQPRVIEILTRHDGVRSVLAAPIRVSDELVGELYLTDRTAGGEFNDADLQAVDAFAVAAGVAISSSLLHTWDSSAGPHRQQIARELHDTVIQRLYGIGVALQGSLHLAEDERLRGRIQRAINDLDATISHVRATIVELGDLPL